MGKHFGEFYSRRTLFAKGKRTADAKMILLAARHPGDALSAPHGFWQGFASHFNKRWFGVEEIDVRRGAGLKEIDHSFGAGSKVKLMHCSQSGRDAVAGFGWRVFLQKGREGNGAQTGSCAFEESPPGDGCVKGACTDRILQVFISIHNASFSCRFVEIL